LTVRSIVWAERTVLLANPDLDLHEIASRVGYSDPSSFSRAFRRIARVTPGTYRSLHRR